MCAKSVRTFEGWPVATTTVPGRKTFLVTAVLVLGTIGLLPARPTTQGSRTVHSTDPSVHGPFYLRSYLGKCLTFGVFDPLGSSAGDPAVSGPTPLLMHDCSPASGSPLPGADVVQQVLVEERNSRHEVILRAGGKVIGVMANVLFEGVPLELQDFNGSAGQIWALDGDSLILAAERDLVAEVKNGRTPDGTPIVLGRRDLDASEFWTFIAADGTDRKPTNGFVRVPQEKAFDTAVAEASWGTVIELDQNASFTFDKSHPLEILDGVTIRGDRRGTRRGPELRVDAPRNEDYPDQSDEQVGPFLIVHGDYVRITGLRLRGPSGSTDHKPRSTAVVVEARPGVVVEDGTDGTPRSAIVDHNEISDWTLAGVLVTGRAFGDDYKGTVADNYSCPEANFVDTRLRTTRVVRNFIHHNASGGMGYGVVVSVNGFATIEGNTFLYNRHAIAGDGTRLTGYGAFFNLVLSSAPEYGFFGSHEHDFDMHGSESSSHHTGGIAGFDVEIAWNTFLGTNRYNYDLRGEPCALHRFDHNVAREGEGEAIHWYIEPYSVPPPPPPLWLEISNNHFSSPDPTRRLGVGDFDGDGKQDLFLATGTAWYYAPGGRAEWRYLNAQTYGIGSLLFGDFDGDGRTDVVIRSGASWLVSWAGASRTEKMNAKAGAIADFAVGDFDGNGRADLLYTNGTQWLVSSDGTSPFMTYAVTPQRVADLRFGDFDGDGRTDAFAVFNGYWMVRYGGTPMWVPLRLALSSSVDHLIVADFDGNGRADVATTSYSGGFTWKVSADGLGGWTPLRAADRSLDSAAAIGAFDGAPGVDVLQWSDGGYGRILDAISAGAEDPHQHGREDMR